MASEYRNRSEMEEVELPVELQAMFTSYRASVPDVDASANFMPQLWSRIDSQRNLTFSFGRLAKRFVSVAVASCLAMSIFFFAPVKQVSPVYGETYLDALAADHSDDVMDVDMNPSIGTL